MKLDTKVFLDTVVTMLRDGAENIPVPLSGSSMTPFLHDGDTVFLNLPKQEPKPGDILLYQRGDGQYVLHRVIRIKGDTLWMLGDAQMEKEPIGRDQIRAMATAVIARGQKLFPDSERWLLFSKWWRRLIPLRPAIAWMHNFLSKNSR